MFYRERPKPKTDYLKYWRIIKKYVQVKHKLSSAEVDTLLFLHSENYFDRDKFQEFNQVLSWDVKRFDRLLRDGWIEVFRKNTGKYKALYQLSFKATNVVNYIYKKLEGEKLPTSHYNPMFKENSSYSDKVYRSAIIEMNKEIRKKSKE